MQGIISAIKNVFSSIGLVDILDILIMTYLIYEVILLARKTRAVQLLKGILVLLLCYFVAQQIGFKTVNFVLSNFLQFGIIAIIVVFQPELRRILEQVGRNTGIISMITGRKAGDDIQPKYADAINNICSSCEMMSKNKTGALIIVEQKTGLSEIVATGTVVDATLTSELIETIFYEGSPLHDGAVIVRDGRLYAAGCYLPLSANNEIGRELGTRHRAGLGMSENSDAIVIIVSEETGIISVAQNGVLVRRLDKIALMRILKKELQPVPKEKTKLKRGNKDEQ